MRNFNHALVWKMADRFPELSEGDLNVDFHQHRSYCKPILGVICQHIIKSNTSCVINGLKRTKLEKLFSSETKNCGTETHVLSSFTATFRQI